MSDASRTSAIGVREPSPAIARVLREGIGRDPEGSVAGPGIGNPSRIAQRITNFQMGQVEMEATNLDRYGGAPTQG